MMLLSLLLRRGPVAAAQGPARRNPAPQPGQPYLLTRQELEARRAARARLIARRGAPALRN